MAIKKTKTKLKPIYTKDYYRMEKLVKNEQFQESLKNLLASYKKIGCSIQKHGVKNLEGYLDWMKKFGKKQSEIEKSGVIEEDLPQSSGYWIDNILTEFGYDPKNSKYSDFLESYIFFNEKHLNEPFFETRWIRNEETDKMEFFIKPYAYTKREHMSAFWDEIKRNQKCMKGYIGKSKPWERFNRDLEIYQTYQKVKSGRLGKRTKKYEISIDRELLSILNKKYRRLGIGDIRKAISRIKKLD